MVQSARPNKPFIIRRNFNESLIPKDSELYNETLETYVRFVQGVNMFIMVSLAYLSVNIAINSSHCSLRSFFLGRLSRTFISISHTKDFVVITPTGLSLLEV